MQLFEFAISQKQLLRVRRIYTKLYIAALESDLGSETRIEWEQNFVRRTFSDSS